MKKNNIRTSGNLLLGMSFLTLSALSTRTGNGTDAIILFFTTAVLFAAGTVLKIITHEKHDYIRDLPSALLVSGGVFLTDLILKWLSLEIHTLQSFGSVFFQVATLYPLQPLDEMWYRSFDPAGLLFLTLLFRGSETDRDNPSFLSAFLQMPGDNLPCFLIADILVSTYPVYWYGNHPGVERILMDLIAGVFVTAIRNSYIAEKDPVNQKLQDSILRFQKRFEKPEEILYLITVGSLFFYNFINTTLIPDLLIQVHPEWLDDLEFLNMPMIVLAGILAFFSVTEAKKKEEKNIIAISLLLGFVFYGHSQIGSVFSLFLLIAAGCHKHADRVLKTVFTEGVVIMLLCLIGVQNGSLPDLMNGRAHTLGLVSAVDCYAHWFFLFGMYCLIRKGKFRWYESVISFAWMTYMYYLTTVKTGYVCFLLVFVIMLVNQYGKKKIPSSLAGILEWSFVICAGVYLIALINPDLWRGIPTVWQELSYGKTGIRAYPPQLLDQMIPDYGNGVSITPEGQLFTMDVSYLSVLLEYGILVFLYLIFLETWFLKQGGKEKYRILICILCVTALSGLFQPDLASYWYNVLIILPLADFSFLQSSSQS